MTKQTSNSLMYVGYSNSLHSHIYFQPSTRNSNPWFYQTKTGSLFPLTSDVEKKLRGIEAKVGAMA